MNTGHAPEGDGFGLPKELAVFRRFLKHIGRVEMALAVTFLVIVVALSGAQALLRYSFSYSLWWAQDLMQAAIMATYFLGVSYIYKTRQYILIEFLVNMLPIRLQLVCYLLAQIITAFFAVAMLYLLFLFLPNMMAMRTPMLGLPGWLIPAPIGVASAMMVLTTVYYFWFGLWALIKGVGGRSMDEVEWMALIEEPLVEAE